MYSLSYKSVQTHPYVAVLPIRLPVVSRVAVEEPVVFRPIRAAVSALCCYGIDLFPGPEVHL